MMSYRSLVLQETSESGPDPQCLNPKSGREAEISQAKNQKTNRERGGSGGRHPPRGVIHPPLSKLQNMLPRNGLLGVESLDFQAKKWGNQPQQFLSTSFVNENDCNAKSPHLAACCSACMLPTLIHNLCAWGPVAITQTPLQGETWMRHG